MTKYKTFPLDCKHSSTTNFARFKDPRITRLEQKHKLLFYLSCFALGVAVLALSFAGYIYYTLRSPALEIGYNTGYLSMIVNRIRRLEGAVNAHKAADALRILAATNTMEKMPGVACSVSIFGFIVNRVILQLGAMVSFFSVLIPHLCRILFFANFEYLEICFYTIGAGSFTYYMRDDIHYAICPDHNLHKPCGRLRHWRAMVLFWGVMWIVLYVDVHVWLYGLCLVALRVAEALFPRFQ
ncbi:hypothetical protein BJ878DRAFT_517762 [Calycina marina]|uniref:Uncharacterized protein n=1 Tax=Calycina marina TaxID=1763456 RepID=A0A9P8CCV9_9HELO|nr:hypothetical protein BJ878DRAFT_517762 [Calycina marina]